VSEGPRKLEAYVLVSDEDAVDYGLGTPEDQAAAAARLDVQRLWAEAAWAALPLRTRLAARARIALYEPRHRLRHAINALRGRDCEP